MPALYNGQIFKTELEARWAAFFDLAGWKWQVNPLPVNNWAPDFRVIFECGHSECGGYHSLLVAVLPVERIEDFGRHPCLRYSFGVYEGSDINTGRISEDAGAAFGLNPSVTTWDMSHGAGGGTENVDNWVDNSNIFWVRAKNSVTKL